MKNLLAALTLTISFLFHSSAQIKILFDNTKSEEAGNADWIIDNNEPVPSPAQSGITSSSSESFWTGGISAWGIAMVKLGYYVETLPQGGSITYGNGSNPQDLSNYNVFVVCEPNNLFTATEKTAILNFVFNGGGLFMVSDHTDSDRDGDGYDSVDAWNDLMFSNTVQSDPFGFSIDLTNVTFTPSTNVANLPSSTILYGPAGNVSAIAFHNGATISVNPTANPTAVGIVYEPGYSNTGNSGAVAASCEYGNGRVFLLTDSSPADDGTGQNNNTLYDGWNENNDGVLITNATVWLAENATSINKMSQNEWKVFPNPSSGMIFIQNPGNIECSFDLFDEIGNIIYSDVFSNSTENYDFGKLPRGLYFYRLSNRGKTQTNCLVIY